MPFVETDDGVMLYYEETGSGLPVIFVHEFAGDYRSWEAQVRHFSRRYRCITYNARGFPPSDVPDDLTQYGQTRARDDVKAILDHLENFVDAFDSQLLGPAMLWVNLETVGRGSCSMPQAVAEHVASVT